jgi:hypothetical protein
MERWRDMRKRNRRSHTTKKQKVTVVKVKILESEPYYKHPVKVEILEREPYYQHPVHVRYIRDRLSRKTPSEKSTQAFRRALLDRSE